MKISAHVLVKNEAKFVWYAVMSVINYVDRIRLWDTGSTDGTLEIIKEIQKTKEAKNKVFYRQEIIEPFDEGKIRQLMFDEFGEARQEMLEATISQWFIVVDGDEIWWDDSIKQLTDYIRGNGKKMESIIVPTINLVGDMFHFQEKKAGKYHLLNKFGHYNLRAINKNIPGLKSLGTHGQGGWVDEENKMIQYRDPKKIKYLDTPYLHATHLQRSGLRTKDFEVFKRAKKYKYELGFSFPADYYYPEVFFRPRPSLVPSPWQTADFHYKFRAFFETPLRKLNRRIMPSKIGF